MSKGFKTGGRQKGTLNKTTLQTREKLQKIFDEEIDSTRFRQALDMLPAKEYLNILMRIGTHLLPKANNANTAEIEPEEKKVKKRPPLFTPVSDREVVERRRAADPEEAELAALLYPEKKKQTEDIDDDEQPRGDDWFIRLPNATREESDRLGREIDEVTYAKLVLWNEKNRERWKLEDEETMRRHNENSYRASQGLPQLQEG